MGRSSFFLTAFRNSGLGCATASGLGFRVVAPDQRGYNLSSKPENAEAYRLGGLAADVFGLARAASKERFHVVGHDWGAAVAWTMASVDPGRLLSATMIQAPHPRSG
jgi:pimeloyl-ACP methyl ester carboxylesterase